MDTIGVDIIIPNRNYARYLGEAVDSALAQEGADPHVIVVDDGSEDESLDVLGHFDPGRVSLVRHDSQRGLCAARNSGLQLRRTDWVAFLDSDDTFPAGRTVALLESNGGDPDVMALGQAEEFSAPGLPVPPERPTGLHMQAGLFSRQVIERVGRFDEELVYGGNVDWFARALRLGVTYRTTQAVTLRRRIHDQNMSRQIAEQSADYLTLVRRHGQALRRLHTAS